MSIIKLEFSEDDVIAQKYLGEALVNMARHRETGDAVTHSGGVQPLSDVEELVKPPEAGFSEQTAEEHVNSREPELPWDERIHSGNKTQNQDGSWKKRKKPKDMTSEQWDEFVAEVEAELTTLMSIPVEEPQLEQVLVVDEDTPPVVTDMGDGEVSVGFKVEVSETPAGEDIPKPPAVANDVEAQQADVIASQPDTVDIPKPPVINQDDQPAPPPPPVTDVAPVGNTPDAVEGVKPMTFVQLVQRMSAKCNGDVTKSAKIKDAIKEKYDVEFAALVKRPDLIPQIGAFLDTIEV